jgi:hypothetical protein
MKESSHLIKDKRGTKKKKIHGHQANNKKLRESSPLPPLSHSLAHSCIYFFTHSQQIFDGMLTKLCEALQRSKGEYDVPPASKELTV